MQPINATSYSPSSGVKTAPCRTCGKTGRQPVRRRRLPQRGGARLTLTKLAAKAASRYA